MTQKKEKTFTEHYRVYLSVKDCNRKGKNWQIKTSVFEKTSENHYSHRGYDCCETTSHLR